jgi:hypothetical protein
MSREGTATFKVAERHGVADDSTWTCHYSTSIIE